MLREGGALGGGHLAVKARRLIRPQGGKFIHRVHGNCGQEREGAATGRRFLMARAIHVTHVEVSVTTCTVVFPSILGMFSTPHDER